MIAVLVRGITNPGREPTLPALFLLSEGSLKVSRFLAQKIFERDEWKCLHCGKKLPPYYEVKWGGKLQECIVVDHVTPGNGNEESNLQTLCFRCNCAKSGNSQDAFDITRSLQILGRPVAFYPSIAQAVGMKESLFLCQLIYWTPRARNDKGPGWIYKSAEEMQQETGLTYKEQLRARHTLQRFSILEEKYERTTHRMYFKVNPIAISRVIVPAEREYAHMPIGKEAPAVREVRHMPVGTFVKGTETTTETTHRKPRAQSRSARNRFDDELEQRRKIAAMNQRLQKETEVRKELMVGVGPR